MRTSLAPNRARPVPVPPAPEVSLAVVTHYTDEKWHARRTEVVKLCLDSMTAGAKSHKTELMIWDNGSTPAFRDMLRSYNPDVYIESVNVGPHNARRALCEMARAPIIAITDDDILYSCDWLAKQVEILKTYPNVGVVSGSPMRMAFDIRGGVRSTFDWAMNEPACHVWKGRILTAEQWEDAFCVSLGSKPGIYEQAGSFRWDDWLLEYKGVPAWGHGHHMMLTAYTDIIKPFMLPSRTLIDLAHFNVRIGEAGYNQLTTYDRTCCHIGNMIDDTIVQAKAHMLGPHDPPVFVLPEPTK
jgi:hypothetical protein